MKLPLKYIHINQAFGQASPTTLKFYQELGLLSHNGIDFKASKGTDFFSMFDGTVTFSGFDNQAGGCVIVENKVFGYKAIYYHLSAFNCKVGDRVKEGQLLGKTGNTGIYTTGPHLHVGMKEINANGTTIHWSNGYKGAIDFSNLFEKNWDKCPAYHRYGRKANWFVDWCFRFAPIDIHNQWTESGHWVQEKRVKLGIHPLMSTEKVNAILYGGYSYEEANDDAMYFNWGFLKKDEYLKGSRAF